eukprot:TRINITY_DN4757_c1_g1_i3.p3 TRINITY_DN4757_c1_g1~~TRINITY_DN4757_c1_g1_i3.p3  ORF type:complete len:165 (+),score=26.28 TRINITY_DN4757_c1_g1_i3:2395-2889(+)
MEHVRKVKKGKHGDPHDVLLELFTRDLINQIPATAFVKFDVTPPSGAVYVEKEEDEDEEDEEGQEQDEEEEEHDQDPKPGQGHGDGGGAPVVEREAAPRRGQAARHRPQAEAASADGDAVRRRSSFGSPVGGTLSRSELPRSVELGFRLQFRLELHLEHGHECV